ncbi:MAG: Hsp20/alpha crystallin family protein [Candidatus Pacebacteria bacterium]|nr:Hsp20/alpha crystallin family protein [Candidatus Paceibacterota bacterium]MDD3072539.1 Hsp20/alpha crystallin family protein [Candidatus Paceibacterota bacterium]MDD3729271.1 Hsp20/alpha crystallin family protein [Candidatus Paceibacterota bacterium]MDD4467391.1 Hsp20/alpha crystallin family protein [Candidatus Paceibacterota bacterium]MDD4897427.1 Hsp20/alpha crystallin family protein [Candidatus Paceibacterota bacterium]
MKFFKNKKEEVQGFSSKPIEKEDWFEPGGQLVIDVYRSNDDLIVRAPIAGARTEDIGIVIENDILKISGKREKTEEDIGKSYFLKECYWGTFTREIVLPVEVDKQRTKAKIEDGILIITMPIIEREKIKSVELE